jgi:hypothetical protein
MMETGESNLSAEPPRTPKAFLMPALGNAQGEGIHYAMQAIGQAIGLPHLARPSCSGIGVGIGLRSGRQ